MARPLSSRPKTATIQDIADELGLSAMTVSRALNRHPSVKDATRQRVLSVAEAMNYRPNRWARSLVTRRSQIVGILVPDISHSFFAEITRGVQETIEPHGYGLMLCDSDGDVERELRALHDLVASQVDGLIVASAQPQEGSQVFRQLLAEGVHLVLIDRWFPDVECPAVRVDDRMVGRLAAEYLVGLGHRRIAHIAGPPVSASLLRTEGFRAALEEAGLQLRPEQVANGAFRLDGGHEAMRRILEATERPTAVFAANDPSAIGGIRACREAGLEVPGDISFVGAGSIESSYYPEPFLTTVGWPRRELGRRAAEVLLARISGVETSGNGEYVFEPELLVRRSAAPPADLRPVQGGGK